MGSKRLSALVIGDVMLDIYITGDSERVSPEAPVPVVLKSGERYLAGGAGNVAANLASLGVKTSLAGLTGIDRNAQLLREALKVSGVDPSPLVSVKHVPTPTKTRFVSRTQQLLRLDEEQIRPLGEIIRLDKIIRELKRFAACADFVVFSDYGKGFLDPRLCSELIRPSKFSAAGLKGVDFVKYKGVTLAACNRAEAMKLTGCRDYKHAAKRIKRLLGAEYVCVTLGSEGIYALCGGGEFLSPARARSVYDVTGAGDTVLAVLSFALATCRHPKEACVMANEAAAIVIERFGTSTVTLDEIKKNIDGSSKMFDSAGALADRLSILRKQGKKIVFTNGCFDILHAGHIDLLNFARSCGDILVVGVNSDSSVRINKGDSRPFVPLDERMYVLSALASVDYIVPFDGKTPEELIRKLRPDVLVKGSDWKGNVAGQEFVESYGGRVELFDFKRKVSTTGIAEKVAGRLNGQ